jgi:sugar/nucleoside kinase (ribokinase family)
MKRYDVYALGNALVDKEFEVSDDFLVHENIQKGLMTLVDAESQNTLLERLTKKFGLKKRAGGGSAANTLYAVSQFGGHAFYSCRVANDEFGDFYVNELGHHNIDTNLGDKRPDGVTGKCLIMVSADAERTMLTSLGISEKIDVSDINREALRNSKYLYLEGYLVSSETGRAACVEARKLAEASGVMTTMTLSDAAMVQFFRGGLEEMIGDGVGMLFANETEALNWTGKDTIEEALPELHKIAKVLVVTLGARGALVSDAGELTRIDPVRVKAVDTNGAGDMFAGAFLYGLSTGMSYAQAGDLASHAAARVVSQFGPRLAPEDHRPILEAVVPGTPS